MLQGVEGSGRFFMYRVRGVRPPPRSRNTLSRGHLVYPWQTINPPAVLKKAIQTQSYWKIMNVGIPVSTVVCVCSPPSRCC